MELRKSYSQPNHQRQCTKGDLLTRSLFLYFLGLDLKQVFRFLLKIINKDSFQDLLWHNENLECFV